MSRYQVSHALQNLAPGSLWEMTEENYGNLKWNSEDIPKPTREAVEAEIARLNAEWNATEYQRLRKAEYDKLNQYEMMFDDQLNGTTTWQDAINAIKAQYPKP